MQTVRILKLGRYIFPADPTKPYYVELGTEPKTVQPMTEAVFFDLVNALVQPRQESCGNVHTATVTVQGPEKVS